MTFTSGNKISESGAKYINPRTHAVVPGKTYHTEYTVGGWNTLIPGWQDRLVSDIRNQMTADGHRLEYIELRDKYVTIQWTAFPALAGSLFTPTAIPAVVVYAVIVGIIAIIALYLIVTGIRETKELVEVAGSNTQNTAISLGALVVGALILIAILR